MSIQRGKNSWQVSVTHNGSRFRTTIKDQNKIALAKEIILNALKNGKEPDSALHDADLFSKPELSISAIFALVDKRYWQTGDSRQSGNGKQVTNFFGPAAAMSVIDENGIDEMIEFFQDRGNSNATINRKLAALSKMLSYAYKRKHITYKPTIEWLVEGNSRLRYLTVEEEKTLLHFLTYAQFHLMRDFVTVLIDTGLRRSELKRFNIKDLHGNVSSHYNTKNVLSRSVPLTQRSLEIIKRYGKEHQIPFQNLSYSQIRKQWNFARCSMGLENDKEFVLHTLRHTCASRLVQRGVGITVVKEWLGHKSLAMTLRYAHLAPENLQSALEVLEQPVAVAS